LFLSPPRRRDAEKREQKDKISRRLGGEKQIIFIKVATWGNQACRWQNATPF
jgi:hypothetical protein